jgi:asparagine synthase (glutamine-hydrolysing)
MATCIGDAPAVAVALSGGLDSTAVLLHAHKLSQRDGRGLIAITANIQDDQGRSSATVAQELLDALDLRCAFSVVRIQQIHLRLFLSPAGILEDHYVAPQ